MVQVRLASTVVATSLTLLLSVMSTSSQANVRQFNDARNDTPNSNDIQAVVVDNSTHDRRKLVVVVTTENMDPPQPDGYPYVDAFYAYIDTNGRNPGPEYRFWLIQDLGLFHMRSWHRAGRYVDQSCGYQAHRNLTTDRWRVVIDRSCLNNPGRVRVAIRTDRRRTHDWAPAPRRWLDWVSR